MPEGAPEAEAPTGHVCSQPDGNCLYRAVEDQLGGAGLGAAAVEEDCGNAAAPVPRHEQLRAAAVDYMRNHEEEFAPFVLPVRPFSPSVTSPRRDASTWPAVLVPTQANASNHLTCQCKVHDMLQPLRQVCCLRPFWFVANSIDSQSGCCHSDWWPFRLVASLSGCQDDLG